MGQTCLEGSKVNDTVDGRVLGKDFVEASLVRHVDLVEDGTATAEQLNAVESDLGGVVEAVDDDDIVSVFEEGEGGEGANVASATAR